MEGFTPTFFLQLLIAVGSAGAVYGAIRADLNNLRARLDTETRLREEASRENDESIHDIREHLNTHNGRISNLEGAQRRA